MATQTIRIVIVEQGSKQAAQNISGIGTAATASDKALSLLKTGLAAVGVGSVIKEYAALSSAYQQISNRIRLVTNSTQEQTAVQRELFNVANDTLTPFQDTAELYARLAFNTKNLGLTQGEVLTVTKALNQAVVLSGAGAREASNAIIQLSQGLASGTLRGDELRSVLEQLPFVTDIIAKELNVDRDALRLLASQGKVTSAEIVNAFKKAAPAIAEQFKNVTPTIEQSFGILKNKVIEAVGAFDSGTGASRLFSQAIVLLANNLPKVAVELGVIVTVLGAVKVASIASAISIEGIGKAFTKLFALVAANPLGALIVALGVVVSFFVLFGDQITIAQGSMATLQDFGVAFFQELGSLAATAGDLIGETIGRLVSLFGSSTGKVTLDFETIVKGIATGIDAISGTISGSIAALGSFFSNVGSNLIGIAQRIINAVASLIETVVGTISRGILTVLNGLRRSLNTVIDAANAASDLVGGGQVIAPLQETTLDSLNLGRVKENALKTAGEIGTEAAAEFTAQFKASTGASDFVNDVLQRARTRAAARAANAASGGTDQFGNKVAGSGGNARSKADIAVEQLRAQLIAEKELLDIGQVKGQLDFNQKTGIIRLNQKLREDGVTLNAQQRAELEGLVKSNEEKKIRNSLDQDVRQFTQSMNDELRLLTLTTEQREIENDLLRITNSFREAGIELDKKTLEGLKATREELQRRRTEEEVLNGILGDRAKLQAQLQAIDSLQASGKISDIQAQRARQENAIAGRQGDTSVLAGFENGLDKLALKVTDFASLAEETITNAFSGAEDALVEFVQTGEFNFSKLVDSILADLTRLLARQAISALLGGLTGGASGVGLSLLTGGRAAGGPVQADRPVLVGERGPEIFNPPTNGTITPNSQVPSPQTNVTIVNVMDPNMVTAALSDPRNQQVIINGITSGNNGAAMRKKLNVT